jgi:hypothetical protein
MKLGSVTGLEPATTSVTVRDAAFAIHTQSRWEESNLLCLAPKASALPFGHI